MRVQPDHWRVLLEYCENNPEIITNKFSGPKGRADLAAKWAELTALLNSLGLGEKTIEEWKKTLIDWKSKTKAKAAAISNYQGGTGGGPPPNITLTSFEERLLAIMGKVAVQGNISVKEVGISPSAFKQAGGPAPKVVCDTNSPGPSKRPAAPLLSGDEEPVKKKKMVFIKVAKDSCQALPRTAFIAEKSTQFQPLAHSAVIPIPEAPEQEQFEEHRLQELETPSETPPPVSATIPTAETSTRNSRRRRSQTPQMQQLQNMNNDILEVLNQINHNIFSIAETLRELINIFRNRE